MVHDVGDDTDKATIGPRTGRDLDRTRLSAAKAAAAFLKGTNGP